MRSWSRSSFCCRTPTFPPSELLRVQHDDAVWKTQGLSGRASLGLAGRHASGLTDGLDAVAAVHKVPLVHVDGQLKQAAELAAARSRPQTRAPTPAYRLVTRDLLEDGVFGTHDGGEQHLQPWQRRYFRLEPVFEKKPVSLVYPDGLVPPAHGLDGPIKLQRF